MTTELSKKEFAARCLEDLRQGNPLSGNESLFLIATDQQHNETIEKEVTGIRKANSEQRSAWIVGKRGFGKSQTLAHISQTLLEMSRQDHEHPDSPQRVLLVNLRGDKFSEQSVSKLVLKHYLSLRDSEYRISMKLLEAKDREEASIIASLLDLGFDLIGFLDIGQIHGILGVMNKIGGNPAQKFFKYIWPSKWNLRRKLRKKLSHMTDKTGQPMFSDQEIAFIDHWAILILNSEQPSMRKLAESDFMAYCREIGNSFDKILYSVIRKAGVSTIVFLVDEADQVKEEKSDLRGIFEQHYDTKPEAKANLNFYYFFSCLPSTMETLEKKREEWGFVRKFVSPMERIFLELKGPPTSDETIITANLVKLEGLFAVAKQPIKLSNKDTEAVKSKFNTITSNENNSISWHAYWQTLIRHLEGKMSVKDKNR